MNDWADGKMTFNSSVMPPAVLTNDQKKSKLSLLKILNMV